MLALRDPSSLSPPSPAPLPSRFTRRPAHASMSLCLGEDAGLPLQQSRATPFHVSFSALRELPEGTGPPPEGRTVPRVTPGTLSAPGPPTLPSWTRELSSDSLTSPLPQPLAPRTFSPLPSGLQPGDQPQPLPPPATPPLHPPPDPATPTSAGVGLSSHLLAG